MTHTRPVVLVIEDEKLLLNVIMKKLSLAGAQPIGCTTGAAAFDYLANTTPDIIWLDYRLPDTNGLDLVTAIKAHPAWQDIPIIIVSNSATPAKIDHLVALGVQGYLVKAEHRLEEIVATALNLVHPASLATT